MKVTVIKKQLLLVAALLVAAEAPAYGMSDAWNRMSSAASAFLSNLTIKNVSIGLATAATATAALRPLFSYCKARLELLRERFVSPARDENPILPNEERTAPQPIVGQTSKSRPIREFSTDELTLLMRRVRQDITLLGNRQAGHIQTIFINCYQEFCDGEVPYAYSAAEAREVIENACFRSLHLWPSKNERRQKSIEKKNVRMRKIFDENREEHVNALREIASYITQENIARMHRAVLTNIVYALHKMNCVIELKAIYNLVISGLNKANIENAPDWLYHTGILRQCPELAEVLTQRIMSIGFNHVWKERLHYRILPDILNARPDLAEQLVISGSVDIDNIYATESDALIDALVTTRSVEGLTRLARSFMSKPIKSNFIFEKLTHGLKQMNCIEELKQMASCITQENIQYFTYADFKYVIEVFPEFAEYYVNLIKSLVTPASVSKMNRYEFDLLMHKWKDVQEISKHVASCVNQDNIVELDDHGVLYFIVDRLIEMKSVEGLMHVALCVTKENIKKLAFILSRGGILRGLHQMRCIEGLKHIASCVTEDNIENFSGYEFDLIIVYPELARRLVSLITPENITQSKWVIYVARGLSKLKSIEGLRHIASCVTPENFERMPLGIDGVPVLIDICPGLADQVAQYITAENIHQIDVMMLKELIDVLKRDKTLRGFEHIASCITEENIEHVHNGVLADILEVHGACPALHRLVATFNPSDMQRRMKWERKENMLLCLLAERDNERSQIGRKITARL